MMTQLDKLSLALCAWKECRSGGQLGMQSVINVIINRTKVYHKSVYYIVYEPLQFSSMSYHHDPQLLEQASETDEMWILAQNLAREANNDNLKDLTDGALYYYAKTIAAPSWARKMQVTVIIANQVFLKEPLNETTNA